MSTRLKGRIAKLEQRLATPTRRYFWHDIHTDTVTVEGVTMTKNEFDIWKKSLPPNVEAITVRWLKPSEKAEVKI